MKNSPTRIEVGSASVIPAVDIEYEQEFNVFFQVQDNRSPEDKKVASTWNQGGEDVLPVTCRHGITLKDTGGLSFSLRIGTSTDYLSGRRHNDEAIFDMGREQLEGFFAAVRDLEHRWRTGTRIVPLSRQEPNEESSETTEVATPTVAGAPVFHFYSSIEKEVHVSVSANDDTDDEVFIHAGLIRPSDDILRIEMSGSHNHEYAQKNKDWGKFFVPRDLMPIIPALFQETFRRAAAAGLLAPTYDEALNIESTDRAA